MVAANLVVYNELHRLPQTIAKLQWASEVVIVDQQSIDGTWEWLKDNETVMNLTLIQDKHWGYCEPSRKLAHTHTRSDWIGVVDADEYFTDEFQLEIDDIIKDGYTGVRLKRGFWLGGEFRFAGDYQYRFFNKKNVRFLDEIHTEPQPFKAKIYSPDYVGIRHEKSWVEQIRDEEQYERLILGNPKEERREAKLALNVHLALLRKYNITPQEADAMTIEERIERGIGNA